MKESSEEKGFELGDIEELVIDLSCPQGKNDETKRGRTERREGGRRGRDGPVYTFIMKGHRK